MSQILNLDDRERVKLGSICWIAFNSIGFLYIETVNQRNCC